VLIADDQAFIRKGIRTLLERFKHVEITGEARDGHEALQLIRETKPDVVLLDINMPGLNGFEVLEEAAKELPEVRVVILSLHESAEYAAYALRHGAAGYLPKRVVGVELEQAIKVVMGGETYVSTSILEKRARKCTEAQNPVVADFR